MFAQFSIICGDHAMPTAQTSTTPLPFYTPVVEPLKAVRESITRILPPEGALLAQSIQHSLDGSGKLVRPLLTLLTAQALGKMGPHAIEAAAVAEMIHIATLLHDDVLDDSGLRRGKRTVKSLWGNTVSVLSGDFLLAQASIKLYQVGIIRLVGIFAHVLADLCDGEVEQIRLSYALEIDWDGYYRKTLLKTASLFTAACESGAVIAGLDEDGTASMRTFGREFGIAFQIVDDLLDYTSTSQQMGKPVLDDLRHGLINAPVLLALASDRLDDSQKHILRSAIERLFTLSEACVTNAEPGDEAIESLVRQIVTLIEQADALAMTRQLAEQHVENAVNALSVLPNGAERDALEALCRHTLVRQA